LGEHLINFAGQQLDVVETNIKYHEKRGRRFDRLQLFIFPQGVPVAALFGKG
jgi:hypothetical protein